ncbi:Intracellular ribonuclease LX [Linum perenne]
MMVMMIKNMLLLFMFMLSVSNLVVVGAFDFYRLALQWPPGVCKTAICNRPVPPAFTVHGMWPTYKYRPDPRRCATWTETGLTNNVRNSNVPTLTTAMDTHWPQLYSSGTNWTFWWHEWNDHGTCSLLPPIAYFQKAIDSYLAHDPLNALRLANPSIVPSNTAIYPAYLIQRKVGGNPTLICDQVEGDFILKEIYFCFGKTFVKRYKCTSPSLGTCGGPSGRVKFPMP